MLGDCFGCWGYIGLLLLVDCVTLLVGLQRFALWWFCAWQFSVVGWVVCCVNSVVVSCYNIASYWVCVLPFGVIVGRFGCFRLG